MREPSDVHRMKMSVPEDTSGVIIMENGSYIILAAAISARSTPTMAMSSEENLDVNGMQVGCIASALLTLSPAFAKGRIFGILTLLTIIMM